MLHGVLYHKDPLILFEKLQSGKYKTEEYILLHGENTKEWRSKLTGKMIDPNKVEGIDIYNLESFGAIIPNPVPEFTLEEVFFCMIKTSPYYHEELKDVLIRIGREPSTPVMLKYISCRNKFAEEIGAKYPLIQKQEE